MSQRPFHHGNLRAVLLDEAEAVLREDGLDALSLRDLARRAGVSHGAPRSHFVDRQALLESLAERGFDRLDDHVRAAARHSSGTEDRMRRVARAYVDFAVEEAALVELMFTLKVDGGSPGVDSAAARLFDGLDEVLAPPTDDDGAPEARQRFKLLFAAAVQGSAALITARRVTREQGRVLVEDAVSALCASPLARRVLPADGA